MEDFQFNFTWTLVSRTLYCMASLGPGGIPPPPPPPYTPHHHYLCHSSLSPVISQTAIQPLRRNTFVCGCVCMWRGWGWGGFCWLDWQPPGCSRHNVRCILSLCVQWAAERITVKWDDINYPNPDGSLWNSASTHLSQERTWMVRQRECQRNEMKADKFSREYSQQKGSLLN